jgi:hypothetical protein
MNEEQSKNPIDVIVICDAYESGYGHGFSNDGLKMGRSYFASKEQADAYELGYEKGQAAAAKPKAPSQGWRLVQTDYQRIFNAIANATNQISNGPVKISVRAFWEHLDHNQPKLEGYV